MSSFDVEQGGHQLWTWGREVPELVRTDRPGVAELRSWYKQMDLASAYVLRPLNCLVLDFVVWNRGWVNKQRSGGILDRRCREDLRVRGEVKDVKLIGDEVANGLGLRGANLVDI